MGEIKQNYDSKRNKNNLDYQLLYINNVTSPKRTKKTLLEHTRRAKYSSVKDSELC